MSRAEKARLLSRLDKFEAELREAQRLPPQAFEAWLDEVSPTFTWHWRHLVQIRSHLERVTTGAINRLMLQVPPRHGKSEMVTVRYAGYRLQHNPSLRIIVGAYSAFLAYKFSRKTRRLLQGRLAFNQERKAVDDWETTQGGSYRAVGVGGGVTGTGGDLVIVDDPIKNRKEANSEVYRETVDEWWTDDLYTRLEPGAAMILIMTRWHEDDIAGRIKQNRYGDAHEWCQINLPALAEDPDDPLGRAIGEALCPERYDEEALERIKRVLGDSFYALYQGRPIAGSGNIIKREWFRYYDAEPAENTVLGTFQSWDVGNKEKQLHDPSVCTTWKITRLGKYLVHEYRDRVTYPELKAKAQALANEHKPNAVLIEDKGNGTALIQDLRATTQIPVVPIEPIGEKVMRLAAESTAYETGSVYHPLRANAPWIADFEGELLAIPQAPNDDRGDSTSQFLKWIREHGLGGIPETAGRRAGIEVPAGAYDLGGFI